MYRLILMIQCFSVVVLFVECWVVFTNWKSVLHSYLFLSCAATLVNSTGYLLELTAQTEEAYFTALRLSYLGRVWAPFALLLFATELVGARVPRFLKNALALFSAGTYITVLTTKYTGLYYKTETVFSRVGEFGMFSHTNGIWYHAYAVSLMLYTVAALFLLCNAIRKETDEVARQRLKLVLLAILVQSTSVIVEMLRLFYLTHIYDITMLSFPAAAVIILVAIFRYDLLDTESLARDFVVDELSEAIIAVDAWGTVSYYNKPALALFPELRSAPQGVAETIRAAVASGEPLVLRERVFRAESNELARNRAASGTLYALLDETDHYRYMEELREQRRIADDANRAKSAFLANMSHEIRTPINAILGMDEMILRESGETGTLTYAEDIRSAGRTLLSLVNDILDFSKVEEGKMEILPTQYDLGSLINDLMNMILGRAESKGLRFDVQVDDTVPHLLYGDEIRIRQCALNVLTNAVKYTEKGSVTMTVSYEKRGEDKIALTFRIADTGIGIKPEAMEKLFSPFDRIEESRNRSIEGTGLGMSITQQLLTLMGSKLEVESVYGEGSTFWFTLEQDVIKWEGVGRLACRMEPEKGGRKRYRELFHAPEARILVTDDTEANLTVIRGLLKRTRVTVDTAESGAQTLEMAQKQHYDVILLDHMMPQMDGIETLHELRKLPGLAEVPCVALTANAVSGAREFYLAEGFSDYLSKPIDGEKLEKLLMAYLPPEKVHEPEEPAASRPGKTDAAATVLIVDDDEVICRLASEILGKSFRVASCQSGADAPREAEKLRPDLILLDINLGALSGFDVLRALRADAAVGAIPVIFLTGEQDEAAEIEGFRLGAADFVRKPFVPEVLLQRTRRIIALDRLQRSLQSEVKRQTLRAGRLTKEMMLALSKTVDAKDHYTNGHSERVAAYSAEIARRMGKSAQEQEKLYEMGLMHDIGKIGVAEEIINKNGRLTDEEYTKIRRHTVIGSDILHLIDEMPELAAGARSHHERYDGGGYPDGLKGSDIPEAARIICLADCYDAMTSTRTYSKPREQSAVRAEIERCAGTQFDPDIAKIVLQMIDEDVGYVMTERTADIHIWRGSDKLWTLDAQPETEPSGAAETYEAAEGAGDDAVELPDWLERVEDLDTASGLLHCGTEETYLDTLTIYAKNAPASADEIERLWGEGDLENTTVKVHALKSMSRTIGAEALGALAEKLEFAGKAGDAAAVGAELGDLLARFRALGAALSPLCAPAAAEEDESLPLISDAELREAYDGIREFAASMDSDGAAYVLDYLKGFRLPAEEQPRADALRQAVANYDWDQIDGILS